MHSRMPSVFIFRVNTFCGWCYFWVCFRVLYNRCLHTYRCGNFTEIDIILEKPDPLDRRYWNYCPGNPDHAFIENRGVSSLYTWIFTSGKNQAPHKGGRIAPFVDLSWTYNRRNNYAPAGKDEFFRECLPLFRYGCHRRIWDQEFKYYRIFSLYSICYHDIYVTGRHELYHPLLLAERWI